MLSSMRFRPKSAAGGTGPKEYLPLPGGFQRMKAVRGNRLFLVILAVLVLWILRPLLWLERFSHHRPQYPAGLPPGCKYTVPSASQYIYPPIEDADLLRKIDVTNLIHITAGTGSQALRMESLNFLDDADPARQKIKEDNENENSPEARAINSFKNQAKVIYEPKLDRSYPKVVIVTALDFDRYSTGALAKLVQNRVDYAHEHEYGIYVRWAQEFIPEMNSVDFLGDRERSKWIRLYCLRAAMFAFPKTEWFWYFDQDGLITNMKVNLHSYVLTPEAWSNANLREQPVIPPSGLIKTYKNIRPSNVDFIFTQSETKIETNSFIVRNSEIGRAAIEMWRDRLYMNYNNFPYGPDSAITHILQWHPFMLSKTSIVSARTINSFYNGKLNEGKASDHMHYFPGDFIAQWADCASSSECEQTLQKVTEDK